MTGQMTTRQRKKIKSSVCEYKTSLHIDPAYKPVHETDIYIYMCEYIRTHTDIYIYGHLNALMHRYIIACT